MNILFDLYGTLADIRTDEHSPAFWERLARGGAGFTREEYFACCARHAARLPADGEIDLALVFAELTGYEGEKLADFARFFRAESRQKLRLYPFAKELVCGLRGQGKGVGLLSNAQACFTREELSILGLDASFDGILLSSEAGVKKPSPAFFARGLSLFGWRAEECVYVGNDLRDDVGGAHGAGMRCLYLETEQSGVYPSPPEPDLRAKDLAEAYEILSDL